MKAEITLPQELVDQVADRLIRKLKPVMSVNGCQEQDIIFDAAGLAKYMRVSKKWIYEKTHHKEIPHLKVGGQLRFRKKDIDKWLDTYNVPAVSTPERILKVVKGK